MPRREANRLTNDVDDAVPNSGDLAVVVCAYTEERWEDIVEAIDSLRTQSARPGEIVLVIDHNPELYAKAAAEFGHDIQVVENHHRQGLSGARNTGIESSTLPIIAFLDDDAAAYVDWAEKMISPYADPNVIGVGGFVNPVWLGGMPKWWPEEFNWVVGGSYEGLPVARAEIRNPIGASMSVRRTAFDLAGGFNPAMGRIGKHPVGCEETEFFIRVRQRVPNTKVIYEPSSRVGHKVPGTRSNIKYFTRRCMAEGLSKSMVSQLVGSGDGLESEWTYTLKTLPLGILKGLGDGLKGRPSGFQRAGAIFIGLSVTTIGYIRGRILNKSQRNLISVPSKSEVS